MTRRRIANAAAALLVAYPALAGTGQRSSDIEHRSSEIERTAASEQRPSDIGRRSSDSGQRESDSGQRAADIDLGEARRLIDSGEAARAVSLLEKRDRGGEGAQDLQAALLLGVAYYHADQPGRAVQVLAPIADRFPPDSAERREADRVLGLAAFVTGRFAEAVPRLEATERWAKGNPELNYALAQAYIRIQKPEAARGVLARLYAVAQDSAAARVIAAQIMVRLEMNDLAETELRSALVLDPRAPNANFLLGQLALFRGRLDEAVSRSVQELAVNPSNAMALSQLGDAYVRQAKWDEAIVALQKSIWLNPYYSAPYILLGRAYMKKEQPSIAEGMLRRAIEYDPNNRAAHYLLGQLLQQTGRPDDAQREFEIAERLPGTRGG